MEAKVIKNIGSLVEDDILNYDKVEGDFYINKEEEVIEKNSTRKKILKVTVGEWFVKEHPSYFCLIDDNGNEIVEERIHNTPEERELEVPMEMVNPSISQDNLDRLKKENEELKKKLNMIENDRLDMNYVYYPRRWSLVW